MRCVPRQSLGTSNVATSNETTVAFDNKVPLRYFLGRKLICGPHRLAGRRVGRQISENVLNAGQIVLQHSGVPVDLVSVTQCAIENPPLLVFTDPTNGVITIVSPSFADVKLDAVETEQHTQFFA